MDKEDLLTTSLAMRIPPKKILPLLMVDQLLQITLTITNFNILAKTLSNTLYMHPTRKMSLKPHNLDGFSTFRIEQ